MAAPSFVSANTGVVITGASGAVTKTCTVGNFLILHVLQDAVTSTIPTLTSLSGVENLAGTDNAMTVFISASTDAESVVGNPAAADQSVWFGRVIGTSVSVTVNIGAADAYCRIYEVTGVNTGTTLADVVENGVDANFATVSRNTNTTVEDAVVVTNAADRLALNAVAINDDLTGLAAFTGETGGDWTLAGTVFESGTGTDGTIALMQATIAAAGTINGGTATITSDAWGVAGFALIPAAAAAFVARPPQLEWQQAVGRASVW